MTHAPCAQALVGSKPLSGLAGLVEVVSEWGFQHASECTQTRYDVQAHLYPLPVLVANPRSAHARYMRWSLKDARKRAKLSQEALGLAVNSGRSTIVKLEQGTLPFTEEWAKRLAPALGIKPHQLIYDEPQVRIVGYVGAGQRVYAYPDMEDSGETIARPPMTSGDLLAVEVRGESMLPLAEEGWHIVYTAEATVDENECLNRVCVVQLDEDESMLVKRVLRGSKPQHYHLMSTNAPLIEDAKLRWAAVVKAIVPR